MDIRLIFLLSEPIDNRTVRYVILTMWPFNCSYWIHQPNLVLFWSTCIYTGWSKSLCAPDDYSTKNTKKYFKQFQSLTMVTYLELGITDGVNVSLVSPWSWRLAAKQSDWAKLWGKKEVCCDNGAQRLFDHPVLLLFNHKQKMKQGKYFILGFPSFVKITL
jgi:hypothetical protein